MWLYTVTGLLLLDIVKSAQVHYISHKNEKAKEPPKQTEVIFADVIKNISRVNNVLQELINNYEQLQKIYKSQENVQSEFSDSEIDEIFKSKKGKKRSKDEGTTKKGIVKTFAATQMYWSDHDDDDDDDDDDSIVNDFKEETKTTRGDKQKTNAVEPKSLIPAKTTTLKPLTEGSSDESSDSSEETDNIVTVKQAEKKKINQNLKNFNPQKPKQPKAEVIFVDTHKKTKEERVKPAPKLEPVIQVANIAAIISKPKTRYSKVSQNDQVKGILGNIGNDTRKVKKMMYSEAFSPKKIWDDIINNKPIQLEAHNEITVERRGKKINKTEFDLRSKNGKTALVVVTKNQKQKNKVKEEEMVLTEDEITSKEELKTNVLRQAYGDACLKLVVKKCYKACQKVVKSVCSQVKCKKPAKQGFISFAKTGCLREFRGNGVDKDAKKDEIQGRGKTHYRGHENGFVDMTREGFLSAACLPHVEETKEISLRNDTPHQAEDTQNLNILRDRFERACKKISSKKCNHACKYAYTKTCSTHECTKRMKKYFKKTCKSRCKSAYQLSDRDSSDSDDSDDSDGDDSDDDDDSDDLSD